MTVKITIDKLGDVIKAISQLSNKDVLVGIPDSAPERTDTPITNAQIGYVMETGSPANNIPARPFLVPGIASVQEEVAARLRNGALSALSGSASGTDGALKAAGMVGQSAVKKKINDGPFTPLSPRTIAQRKRGRQTQSTRKAEKQYAELLAQGKTEQEAQDIAGIKPLINTGSLRNSVTFVVRKK
ncbi:MULTISPECIES: hypothetical protein [unclassified Burkholderia]|uniref:hypothetical protein n=1 Tax=unclassified Burkholderia TaxID=2613784 RepID=UPI000F5794AE|nr:MULTISPECIES: hypothetical protein [unclassified Burkholderia]RQR87722.1 hypothetical protein DIE10_06455 [Burkholderia sp. Bp9011]RQR97065.1 hypothetical protein DIE09_06630 [Burkholderia sp. Bp9010]